MKTRKLWPVTAALTLLLSGSISLEILARHRQTEPLTIRIGSGESSLEDDGGDGTVWIFGAPQGVEHEQARRLAMRGQYEQALSLLAEVETEHPDLPMLRAERAHWLLRLDRAPEALSLLGPVVSLLPGEPRLWLELAKAQRAVGQDAQALDTLRAALARHPRHARLRLLLGERLRESGAEKEAIGVLEPAARSGGNDERAYALASLGRCHVATGAYQKAKRLLDEAVERAPAAVDIWMRVARAYLESPRTEERHRALEYALAASKLAPDLAAVHGLAGRAYESLGRVPDAVQAYRTAVALGDDYLFARKRLLRLGLELEDVKLARQQALGLLRIDPERPEHHFLAGLTASRAGDADGARDHYRTAIERAPDGYPEAWYNLGLLERDRENRDAAIQAYEQAIELRPGYLAAYNNLGLVYLDDGDHEHAEDAFHRALGLNDGYGPAWANLARSLFQRGDNARAVDAYRRAVSLAPNQRGLRVQLAIALRKAGRAEEAILLYRELLKKDPRYVNGWYNLGVALDAAGRSNEALTVYRQALALDPDHSSTLKNLALLETRLELWSDARTHLSDALDRSPADAELRLGLARTLLAQNDRPQCSHAVRLVLAQEPDSAQAKHLLEQCSR